MEGLFFVDNNKILMLNPKLDSSLLPLNSRFFDLGFCPWWPRSECISSADIWHSEEGRGEETTYV